MKLRTINAIICKKFDAWVATITDAELAARVRANTVCTGGAIASMLLQEEVNDFDFYFRDFETTKRAAQYYVNQFKLNPPPKFANSEKKVEISVDAVPDTEQPGLRRVRVVVKSAGVASEPVDGDDNGDVDADGGQDGYEYFESKPDEKGAAYVAEVLDNADEAKAKKGRPEKPPYRPVFLSTNAISLSDDVQVVVRFYGEPASIHANYDFVHVTNFWTSWERRVTVNQAALLSLMNRDLRYVGSRYPLCSLFRMRKFLKRGWNITAGQVLKITVNLQHYNLLDIRVLEEQLTGVDVAYFADLIARLQAHKDDPADPAKANDTKVDEAYLAKLIDRLF